MTTTTRNFIKILFKYLFILSVILSVVSSSPVPKGAKYDQRQEGEMNIRADLNNILVLFIPSGGLRLVDNPNIGSILQIFGNSRKNPIVGGTLPTKDSPYKVDIDQSAIDKLQSDIDALNNIVPITKIENKESDDQKLPEDEKTIEEKATSEIKQEESIIATTIIPQDITTTKLSSEQPEITTTESIVTSTPIKSLQSEKEKITKNTSTLQNFPPKTISPSETSLKTQQNRNIESQLKTLVRTSSAASKSSSNILPTNKQSKNLDSDEQQNERKLKALQTGLTHCLPGQRLTENGSCIETDTSRERQEKMERLLSLLRFGVQPANSS
ncbi:uncharacterized protein LOC142323742 isoform X2 [Lycorma delicatula]|uniref:uncharacterized protein LOC142323742 isoform X2 n=1 Tax=Lycorma delicatula TaxID=130591 RepID=UPI003F5124F4